MQTETKGVPAAGKRRVLSPTQADASAKALPKATKDPLSKVAAVAPPSEQAATTVPTATTPPAPAQPPAAAQPLQSSAPSFTASWSREDETTFQAMLARRKAAGFQRRGRVVGAQLLCVGEIKPNPGTIVATVVHLVAERGTVTRHHLLDAMATATFPHAKARP